MNLYIRIENGQAVDHPALEDNLIDALGSVPDNWERFNRVEAPTPNLYQVLDPVEPSYQKVDGVWTDVWTIRDMTDEEKSTLQESTKSAWTSGPNYFNFTAWTYDESTNTYVPPVAKPTDTPPEGQVYRWQGSSNSWQLAPVAPTDGQHYIWNFNTWAWEVVSA
jgi:hypothetical protein